MKSSAVIVASTPTLIVEADDLNRWIYIHNSGGTKIYLGGPTVTTADGYHLANAESVEIFLPMKETIFGIVGAGTNTITILTPNSD